MSTADHLARLAARRAPLPLLRTPRLLLRPFREEDKEPFAAMNADPDVMEHFPAPLTRAESDALIERLRAHVARAGFGMWAAQRDGALIGMVGLHTVAFDAPFTPAVEIAWRLRRDAWGQGLAHEAATAVLRHAADVLGLPRVVSFTSLHNTRSWRLMERLGLVREGTFEHPAVPEGHRLREHVLYATPAAEARPADAPVDTVASPPPAAAPRTVWIDGDGCPRAVKDTIYKAAMRGPVHAVVVANREVAVPRHARIRNVVVRSGLDVADAWLVAHANPGDLVITSDVPLAAELVPKGVCVLGPRGDRMTASNIGERLSIRDFATEARAAGLIEGGGPPPYDERAHRQFAAGLQAWVTGQWTRP